MPLPRPRGFLAVAFHNEIFSPVIIYFYILRVTVAEIRRVIVAKLYEYLSRSRQQNFR